MPRILHPKKDEPIRLLPSNRYRVVVDTAPKGSPRKQVTRTFDSLREARAFVVATRDQINKGTYIAPNTVTVNEMCDRWLRAKESDVLTGDLRRVTLDGYRTWLGPVRRYLGARKVADLRHSDIEDFKAWALREGNAKTKMPSPLGPDAVSGALGLLTRVLHLAVLDRLISINPAAEVERPSRKKKPRLSATRYWTPAQLSAFCQRSDEEPLVWRVALRLVLCGLRRSEVLGLSWDAVDLDAGTVEVRQGRVALADGSTTIGAPKSRASARVVPVDALYSGTVTMLRDLRKQQAAERLSVGQAYGSSDSGGLVFVDQVGRALRPEALSNRFWAVGAAAGLPRIKMHEIRHSLATVLAADSEVADIDAAALLGHDVSVFHAHYAQRSHDAAARAAAAMGGRLRGSAAEGA